MSLKSVFRLMVSIRMKSHKSLWQAVLAFIHFQDMNFFISTIKFFDINNLIVDIKN